MAVAEGAWGPNKDVWVSAATMGQGPPPWWMLGECRSKVLEGLLRGLGQGHSRGAQVPTVPGPCTVSSHLPLFPSPRQLLFLCVFYAACGQGRNRMSTPVVTQAAGLHLIWSTSAPQDQLSTQ